MTWVTPRAGPEPRLVLYVHGGGFTVGSSHTLRDLLSRLALASSARVLSVDYRLAPEHPWPAGLDDVRAVWRAALADPPRGRSSSRATRQEGTWSSRS